MAIRRQAQLRGRDDAADRDQPRRVTPCLPPPPSSPSFAPHGGQPRLEIDELGEHALCCSAQCYMRLVNLSAFRVTLAQQTSASTGAPAAVGHIEIVRLLLECGANVKATNKYGRTPLDVAKGEDVAALLRKSGGIPGVQGEYEEQSGSHRETESESDPATPPKRPEMFGWSRPKLNAATLSGAIDVVVVRGEDGSLQSSPFHVRFGKFLVTFPSGRRIQLHVNGKLTRLSLQLGLSPELGLLSQHAGWSYRCGGRPVVARLYLLDCLDKLIISDVDGTITRSDLIGHLPAVRAAARFTQCKQFHPGVPELFSMCEKNGYWVLYLTARPAGLATHTLALLASAREGSHHLPGGPLILSPSPHTSQVLDRELIRKLPHVFKIEALSQIRALWPSTCNPFAGAFGNKSTDSEAYLKVGVPADRVFIVEHTGKVNRQNSDSSTREGLPVRLSH
ncbi:MAG: hypothetical protein SGPRY_000105 [Prymnesium sp.]